MRSSVDFSLWLKSQNGFFEKSDYEIGVLIPENRYIEIDLFKNISYLNKFIEPELINYFKKFGNKIVIK